MTSVLFCNVTAARSAYGARSATRSVIYAAPGIQDEVAGALADAAARLGEGMVTICLDFSQRVLRMGFGTLIAVQILRAAGIEVQSTPGLRLGVCIFNGEGYLFAPVAHLLEAEGHGKSEAPNGLQLYFERA